MTPAVAADKSPEFYALEILKAQGYIIRHPVEVVDCNEAVRLNEAEGVDAADARSIFDSSKTAT